jgi:hypothetical protein
MHRIRPVGAQQRPRLGKQKTIGCGLGHKAKRSQRAEQSGHRRRIGVDIGRELRPGSLVIAQQIGDAQAGRRKQRFSRHRTDDQFDYTAAAVDVSSHRAP